MAVSRGALTKLSYALVALGLAVGVGGAITSRSSSVATTAIRNAEPVPTPTPTVRVAALSKRVPAHLIIISKTPLRGAQERALIKATGARAALAVSAGTVFIGKGRTTALGVDPGAFRAWTPKGTAESDPVWQSVLDGEGAVAHVVGRAFELPLGGPVLAHATFSARLEVGSFATTALPGIGLVVDGARAAELGLLPHTALILSIPQRNPDRSAVLARRAMRAFPGMSVGAVQYERLPLTRTGWVVPTVGRVSSGFGLRLHPLKHVVLFHDGIDIAARYGAPVYAMSDGFVLYAGPARGFGTEVVVGHKGGVTTVYGHVSRILVSSGPVRAGQPLALVGNEGESTGPHLHAEVRVNDRSVDPLAWLRAHGVRI